MEQEREHVIDWLRRRCEQLLRQKDEVWRQLTGIGQTDASAGMADGLFSQSLELEIELCRNAGLKAHLEGGAKPLPFDDAHIGGLFDSVHIAESALVERFESWKENRAGPLAAVDFHPWRDAMNAYFRASPGEA